MRNDQAVWLGKQAAFLLAVLVLALALQASRAHADDFIIFAAPPPLAEGASPTAWDDLFDAHGGPEGETRRQIITALEAAERKPSMATAIGLLRHFETFAKDDYDAFRQAAIKRKPELFLMADAAKYELVAQTNRRLQDASGGGIAASVRVGSSGGRFAQWLDWVRRGRPADAMPIDEAFIVSKLFRSDDDVTNWATPAALSADSAANERLNGAGAGQEFAKLTQEYLVDYPEEYKAALGGVDRLPPEKMMIEFLSPTRAFKIIANAELRAMHGWSLAQEDFPTYFVELIHSNEQKYNGLFAEEQLHAWGRKAGIVTLDVTDPIKKGSTMGYAEAADSGKLAHIADAQEFPKGINDAFGWMANNYRQIFEVHHGDLDSVAKYTLRMVSWWESVGLTPEASLRATADFAVPGEPASKDYDAIKTLMDAVRSPTSAEQKKDAIKVAGGQDEALARLKAFNRRQMVAGHRKHIEVLTKTLVLALRHHAQQPAAEGEERKPLTLEEAVKLAESKTIVIGDDGEILNHAAIDAQSKQYGAFRQSLDALVNAYANLPDDMVGDMARDMADQLKRLEAKAKTSPHYDLVLRVLPVITDAAGLARRRAGDIREGSAAFRSMTKLANSPLGKALNEHLAEMAQPNLHDYILKVAKGEVHKRRIHVDWQEGSFGLPKIRIVEEHLTPSDVAADFDRLRDLADTFLWSNKKLAERLAASFEPDPAGAVNLLRAMGDFYDPSRIKERTYSYTDAEGRTVTAVFKATRFSAGLNLGHVLFLEMLKSPERFQWAYGIYGDVSNAKTLVENLSKVFIGSPGQTREEVEQAYAASLAGAIDLVGYAESFAKSRGQTGIAAALGSESLVGRYGGTLSTIASHANDPLTPEAADALTASLFKDALLAVAPELAPVFLVHGLYSQISTSIIQGSAESDFVKLLVRNGDWQVPDDGSPPRLLGVFADHYIAEDAPARAAQCKTRLVNTTAKQIAAFQPIGIEPLLKLGVDATAAKTTLCASTARDRRNRECRLTSEQVEPRTAMLQLYKAGGFEQSDPAMRSIIDSVNDVAGWTALQRFMKAVLGQDTAQWTRRHLEENGIHIDAREDGADFLKTKIAIDDEPKGMVVEGGNWGIPRTRAVRTHLQTLSIGSRKVYGYLIAQFWARRQYAMECVLLDPLIAKAGEAVLRDRAKTTEAADFIAEVEKIDARIKQIDARLWPMIAGEADPYRDANLPAGDKLAVYADFRDRTASQRIDLKAIQDWFTTDGLAFDKAPWQVLFGRVVADGDSADAIEAARTEAAKRLLDRGHDLLVAMTDAAIVYEKSYSAAMTSLAQTEAGLVDQDGLPGAAGGLDIKPYNLHLLEPDSFNPPPVGFGSPLDNLPARQGLLEPDFIDSDAPRQTREQGLAATTKAMEGRIERLARDWRNGYLSASDKARDDLTESIRTLLADLDPLAPFGNGLAAIDVVANPIREFAKAEPADLALTHPLLPRLKRLRYQIRKLDSALADSERIDGSRVIDILASMTTYDARGLEAAETMLLDANAQPAVVLTLARSRLEKRYAELLELAQRMFELDLNFDGERADIASYSVTEEAKVEARSRPIEGSGIEEDAIKSLAANYVWELVPADGEPIEAKLPEGMDKGPAPVACGYDTGEQVMLANFEAVSSGKAPGMVYPLAESGNYRIRLTVLTKEGVPVSQADARLKVRPALLKGELKGAFSGAAAIRLAEKDKLGERKLRFELVQPGTFIAALCRFHDSELLLPGTIAKRMKGLDWLDTTFAANASINSDGQTVASPTVEVRYRGKALFELAEPLGVADAARVALKIDVVDASGAPIVAETQVSIDELSIDAATVAAGLALKDGDRVHVEARLETPAGPAEGSSGLVYVAEEHGSQMTIEVRVPAFAAGNLKLTGRLVAPADGTAGPVAGGQVWANILASETPETVGSDGRFTLVNSTRPIRIVDGIAVKALAHGPAPERLLLASHGTVRAELVEGPSQPDLEVPVAPFTVGPLKVTASVNDARTRRMEDRSVKVEIGDQAMRQTGENYETEWRFTRWDEEAELRAAYPMPDGTAVEQRHRLRLADVDDPFAPAAPEPVHFDLPVYPPGTLQVVYKGSFADKKPGDDGIPAVLRVFPVGASYGDDWQLLVGEDFPLDLSFPVAVSGPDIGLTLKATRDDVAFSTLAKAPPSQVSGSGEVHRLDLGELILGTKEELVLVPDVVGKAGPVARKMLEDAKLGAVLVERGAAKRRSLIAMAYAQDPDAGDKSTPRRVKRGTKVTVTTFGPVLAPALKGQSLEAARAAVAEAELLFKETDLGPAPDGVAPRMVTEQVPAADVAVGQDGIVEVRYHSEPKTAAVDPQPTTPADDTPPAPAEGSDQLAGGWAGTVKVVSFKLQADAFGTLACSSFEQCGRRMLQLAVKQAEKERLKREQEEAERQRKQGKDKGMGIGDALRAPGEAVVEGIGAGLGVAMVTMGLFAVEIMFQGTELGLVLQPTESAYMLTIPGLPPEARTFLDQVSAKKIDARTVELSAGNLRCTSCANPDEALMEISGKLVLDEKAERLKLDFSLSIVGRGKQKGQAALVLSGDFARSLVPPVFSTDALAKRFKDGTTNPSLDMILFLKNNKSLFEEAVKP